MHSLTPPGVTCVLWVWPGDWATINKHSVFSVLPASATCSSGQARRQQRLVGERKEEGQVEVEEESQREGRRRRNKKKRCDSRDSREPITGEEMMIVEKGNERKVSRKWRRIESGRIKRKSQGQLKRVRERKEGGRWRESVRRESRFSRFSPTVSNPRQAKLNKHK